MKMWSGRFRQGLDPEFECWQRSFEFDRRLLAYELRASAAHAKALKHAGVLLADELTAVLEGLEGIGRGFPHFSQKEGDMGHPDSSLARLSHPTKTALGGAPSDGDDDAEDVHHFVEKQLVARIGQLGYKLHSGRSRNEQIATDLRLFVRAAIDQLRSELGEVCVAFLERAEQAGTAAMPAYTHLQHAEPVLVGHWLLAYVEMFLRDAHRLEDCRKRVNLCPLGSGAVAGATLPLDRSLMVNELEFDAPTANSMDATSDRDFVIEFVNALSLLSLHLSRWAEEMIIFSSQEFGFTHLPEAYSTGSSAMPQKKNPDLLELVRGKCGRIVGSATALTITMKGLPLAYNKDMQEMQQPLFDAADAAMGMLPMVAGFMRAVQCDFEHMNEAAGSWFMNAWSAATYLVKKGVPSRLAHEQVGKAVKLCLERNCELQDLLLDDLCGLNPAFGEDFYECLQTSSVLAIHDVVGGTAPARVRQAIAAVKKKIEALREEAHAHA
jgi:argininosuccinate lyase